MATSHIEEFAYDFGTKDFEFRAKSNVIRESLKDVNEIEGKKFYKWNAQSITQIMLISNPLPNHKAFEFDEIIY